MDKVKLRAVISSLGFVENSCWIFPRALTNKGYTKVYFEGRQIPTHRASYMTLIGDIPENLPLDHLCRNRACINPAHLEPVSLKENILRGECPAAKNFRKTKCLRGHEFFFDENRGGRRCKICAKNRYISRYIARPSVERIACKKGHPYDGTERIENRGRVCRECSRMKTSRYRAKRIV